MRNGLRILIGFLFLGLLLVLAGAAWGLLVVGYRWLLRWLGP